MSESSNAGGHGASMRSWIVCFVILAGFIVGGVALIYWDWTWFWIGVAIAVIGVIAARAVNMMEDVTEYGGGTSGGSDPAGSY